MMKKTTYVVRTLLCVLVIALVIMAVKSFMLVPVSSHDYPYVNKGVFRPETFNSYMPDTPPQFRLLLPDGSGLGMLPHKNKGLLTN